MTDNIYYPQQPGVPELPPPNFIEGEFSPQPSLGNGHRPRRFYYDNQEFDDPGPDYTIRDVLAYLAQTYPELANGSWIKTPVGEYDAYTFYKVTGEKGLDHARRWQAKASTWINLLLDAAETPAESDWAWRSALAWEGHAKKWQEVIDTWRP